ncbi:MAG: pyridoxal phosphate-dependent aminotransferase [Proteobacteria bacterium]|nr:MAG: pyridoxal phosphate-dependent aminotransferase [Pseudomonadota bacterium]
MNSIFREFSARGARLVSSEASKAGFSTADPEWINLGQGQPELGELPGAPPRIEQIHIEQGDYGYGPVDGLRDLKARVAEHYNRLYRNGMPSKFTAENVAIAAGGRVALLRILAALKQVKLGVFSPDYMAFEDAIDSFSRISPKVLELSEQDGFAIPLAEVCREVSSAALNALLLSNPCNPSGNIIWGDELKRLISECQSSGCALILDEYYSQYIWKEDLARVSAAAFIDDINNSDCIIIDGITKNFRYPGFRLGWILARQELIKRFTAVGSFLDGGPPTPTQRAALQILDPASADRESAAVRQVFREKRDFAVERLKQLGVVIPSIPMGTFYVFGSLRNFPPQINSGLGFFKQALECKIVSVPGGFFDLDPGGGRQGPSRLESYIRFSFGSPLDVLRVGFDRMQSMIRG